MIQTSYAGDAQSNQLLNEVQNAKPLGTRALGMNQRDMWIWSGTRPRHANAPPCPSVVRDTSLLTYRPTAIYFYANQKHFYLQGLFKDKFRVPVGEEF